MDEYEAGRHDALRGEAYFAWSDMWSDGYRRGVADALTSIGYVVTA